MKFKFYIFLTLAVLAMTSCKSQYELILQGNDVPEKFRLAYELLDKKKYSKAAEMFESLSLSTKGTAQEDTVMYYWSLCNYRYGDYQTAVTNLGTFVATFPLSPFYDDAQFMRMDCLYRSTYRYELDQLPTYKALEEMRVFVTENPDSKHIEEVRQMIDDLNGRLELKAYKSAYLYYHMEDYLASHYALKSVLKDNADNRYREEILYYIAMSSYMYALNSVASKQRERYLQFVDDYFNVVSEFPDSKYARDLEKYYERAQNILKRTES